MQFAAWQQTYRVFRDLVAHITRAIKGLAGKPKTNWREDTRALLMVLESETTVNVGENRATHSVQSLDVSNTIKFVGPRWFAFVHIANGFKAILLQIGSVGEVADDPSEGVAEVHASSDCRRVVNK